MVWSPPLSASARRLLMGRVELCAAHRSIAVSIKSLKSTCRPLNHAVLTPGHALASTDRPIVVRIHGHKRTQTGVYELSTRYPAVTVCVRTRAAGSRNRLGGRLGRAGGRGLASGGTGSHCRIAGYGHSGCQGKTGCSDAAKALGSGQDDVLEMSALISALLRCSTQDGVLSVADRVSSARYGW